MAQTTIYLPEDLAARVRQHDVPVSKVCQQALGRAAHHADLQARAGSDAEQAAARRMRQQEDDGEREYDRGYALGTRWVFDLASAQEVVAFFDAYEKLRGEVRWDGEFPVLPDDHPSLFTLVEQHLLALRGPLLQGFVDGADLACRAVDEAEARLRIADAERHEEAARLIEEAGVTCLADLVQKGE